MTIILETARLTLRRFRHGDLDELCRIYADPEVRRYFPDGALDRRRTQQELEWFIGGGDPRYPDLLLHAVIHKPSGRFAGRAGWLAWTIEGIHEVEISYLLDKRFWRQGLGTELADALVGHGFVELGLSRLIALIDPGNLPSIRTAEKVGLRFEREAEIDGHWCRIHARAADDRRSAAASAGPAAVP